MACVASLVSPVVLAPNARADWMLGVEPSVVIPVSGETRDALGTGGSLGLGLYLRANPWFLLGARGSGALQPERSGAAQGLGRMFRFGLAVRMRPLGGTREQGRALWIEGVAGGGMSGAPYRPSLEAAVGWDFTVGGLGLSPVVRYTQMLESRSSTDEPTIRILGLGLELAFLEDRSPETAAEPEPEPEPDPAPDPPVIPAKAGIPSFPDPEPEPEPEPAPASVPHPTLLATLHFELDSAELRAEDLPALREVAASHREEERDGLEIHGHADARGTDAYNLRLSRRRALAVMRWLARAGWPRNRLSVEAHGAGQLLDPGGTAEAHARNRRVEIHSKPTDEP